MFFCDQIFCIAYVRNFCVSFVANFLENCLVSRRSLWSIFASFFVFVSLCFIRCQFPWKLFGLKTVTLKPLYLNDPHLSHPSYNVRLTSSIRRHPHHWSSLVTGHHWSSSSLARPSYNVRLTFSIRRHPHHWLSHPFVNWCLRIIVENCIWKMTEKNSRSKTVLN